MFLTKMLHFMLNENILTFVVNSITWWLYLLLELLYNILDEHQTLHQNQNYLEKVFLNNHEKNK